MSSESQPTRQQLRDIQLWLNHLDECCESKPERVLEETEKASPLLASWTSADAYAWLMALRTKAFRFVDDIDGVCETADSVLEVLAGDEAVVGCLELEKGMALNQFDRPREAAASLSRAVMVFERHGDPGGQAWALVALAESYCAIGYQEDPEPLLRRALELSEKVGDQRNARRAWKQLAVVHRHRGQVDQALVAIEKALTGDMTPHTRANYQLERGHLLAWTGRFADSDADYEEAAIAYLAHRDVLGQGNIERALAHNALMLGRFKEGLMRLGNAAAHYLAIGNKTGLGYVLREQASARFAQGDHAGAAEDAERGLKTFRAGTDTLGLAGMLNTTARMQHRLGNAERARQLLDEAVRLTTSGTNPLAKANALALRAEIDPDSSVRVSAAEESARLFAEMGVWSGEAIARAAQAKAMREVNDSQGALEAFNAAVQALRRARIQVIDPGRRADHDFALRDVTTTLFNLGIDLGGADANLACANLLLDMAPLGLRADLANRAPGSATSQFVRRIASLPVRRSAEPSSQRHLLQQLSAVLAAIEPTQDSFWVSFDEVQAAHPGEALLVIGLPQHDGTLPIAWTVPTQSLRCALVPLSESMVDRLDSLGYAIGADRSAALWEESSREWQTELVDVLLPPELQEWLVQPGSQLVVLLPPLLSHLPIEALLIDGVPLGVRTAVARIPAPSSPLRSRPGPVAAINAYLDPALSWSPERAVLTENSAQQVTEAAEAAGLLGANRLTLIGCHGTAETRLDGALLSTDGARVLDAIDLLRQPLTDSVIVFESCYSGRYLGERTGEQLTLATVALVAGARAAVAGLFSLPADDETTGVISAALIEAIAQGREPAEALRHARQVYWESRPERVQRPGSETESMSADAPWAWAGLVAFTH